jgi:hypothetical protein
MGPRAGRLEQPLVRAALAKGLPVVVISPLKVRRYAGAIGQLAKTDAIDARLIAQFGAAVKPVADAPTDPQARKIKDLMVRKPIERPWNNSFRSKTMHAPVGNCHDSSSGVSETI